MKKHTGTVFVAGMICLFLALVFVSYPADSKIAANDSYPPPADVTLTPTATSVGIPVPTATSVGIPAVLPYYLPLLDR